METRLVRTALTKGGGLKAWIVRVADGEETKHVIRYPKRKNPYYMVEEEEKKIKVFLNDREIRALRKAMTEVGVSV